MKAIAIAPWLLLGLSLSVNGCGMFEPPAVPAPSETTPASALPPKQLLTFQPIQGTPYLMAPIDRVDQRSASLSYDSAYDGSYTTHNLVFLDTETLVSQRLFDTNDYLIVSTTEYGVSIEGVSITEWLVYLVITEDTNDDGALDNRDHKTLATTTAAGQGYKAVITGIEQTFGLTQVKSGSLVVAYEQAGNKTVSTIDLDSQTVVATQPLVDLGPEVQ